MIIEWNQHFFSADVAAYPLHPDAPYVPEDNRRSLNPVDDYIAGLDRSGVAAAVAVQAEPYANDHRLMLDAVARYPGRLWYSSLVVPLNDDPVRRLIELLDASDRMVATRLHAVSGRKRYFSSFEDRGVRQLWAAAARAGLMVELHVCPRYFPGALDLIREFETTTVVIDHFGMPVAAPDVPYSGILQAAAQENVYMKLSGFRHMGSDSPAYASIRPLADSVLNAFGPGRLLWGGETPDVIDSLYPDLSEQERAAIKGGNLARLLGV